MLKAERQYLRLAAGSVLEHKPPLRHVWMLWCVKLCLKLQCSSLPVCYPALQSSLGTDPLGLTPLDRLCLCLPHQ